MHYKLLGFSQSGSVRRFSFQRVGIGLTPTAFIVLADLILARKFNLTLQELPSFCSRILEAGDEDRPAEIVVFTEAQMHFYAAEKTADAEKDADKRAGRSRRAALAAAARTGDGVLPGNRAISEPIAVAQTGRDVASKRVSS